MFPQSSPFSLYAVLRKIGLALAAPFFLIVILGALVAVLVDFVWFRLQFVFAGQPRSKALWEF